MSTHGLPNDVLSNLDPFALLIFIPICDLVVRNYHHHHHFSGTHNLQFQIYPALARRGIKFTALKKITWGFGTAAAAMIWAAVVQYYIYKTSPCGKYAGTCTDAAGNSLVSPLNVWIQSGS